MGGIGTKRTNWAGLIVSVAWVPEVPAHRQGDAIDPGCVKTGLDDMILL